MRWLALALACSSPAAKPVPAAPTNDQADDGAPTAKLTGKVTDLDFGCWADQNCGIEVNDVWILIPGGMRDHPPPRGQIIGIALAGGDSQAELKKKAIGRTVDVYAEKVPIYDEHGNISGYDAKRLTIEGSADYYVRAR